MYVPFSLKISNFHSYLLSQNFFALFLTNLTRVPRSLCVISSSRSVNWYKRSLMPGRKMIKYSKNLQHPPDCPHSFPIATCKLRVFPSILLFKALGSLIYFCIGLNNHRLHEIPPLKGSNNITCRMLYERMNLKFTKCCHHPCFKHL